MTGRCFGCSQDKHTLIFCLYVRCFGCSQDNHTLRFCLYVRCFIRNEKLHASTVCKYRGASGCESSKDRHAHVCKSWKGNDRHLLFIESSSNSASDQKIMQTLDINGKQVNFVIDTGAQVSTSTVKASNQLVSVLERSDFTLNSADRSRRNAKGVA